MVSVMRYEPRDFEGNVRDFWNHDIVLLDLEAEGRREGCEIATGRYVDGVRSRMGNVQLFIG